MSSSSIWPIGRTLLDATTPGQNGPGSDGNEGLLRIPQSSHITGASPSDSLMSYPGHSLRVLTCLQRCIWCILQPQLTELAVFFFVLFFFFFFVVAYVSLAYDIARKKDAIEEIDT